MAAMAKATLIKIVIAEYLSWIYPLLVITTLVINIATKIPLYKVCLLSSLFLILCVSFTKKYEKNHKNKKNEKILHYQIQILKILKTLTIPRILKIF